MICPSCNHDNRSGAKFCEECAAPLKRACTGCGSELRPAAKFCDECGTKTDGGARPAPAPSEAPKHLAEKIRQSKATVEGERKQVTVLFADVKGSMELAESLDPEAFSKIMSRFFAILTEGVERFEGFVDKFTGDGIMALFGAPIAHEDHAQRACYAALHLKDEIARYATELKREHGLSFSTRMGLNSGEVVVGSISEDLRMDYTAQGHTVGLAQRMESLAEPNSCFVSANTAALARGYFDLEDLGEFRVKGVANPMHVRRLNGMGTSRTRFDVSRSRGLSRFVGRASDLRTLEDALEQTASGNGQVIGVVAEAGTGKSRLCFEFLERCRAKGMQVFEGRAVAHGRNIPFLPILDVFRSYFGITSEDNDNGARVKIAGHMMVLDQKFADTLPLVYDFLGVADPQNPAPRLDPEVRQRQLIGVIRQIIRSASEKTPTVTMVEDLHWLDAASAEFLEHMVDARAGTHSLLLLNFRPEYRAEWMQKSWYRQIPLTPLDERATAELLTSLLGSHQSIASLAVPIHQRTGGNPFFIEEVVQNLIETKHVEGSAGSYRLVTALDRLEVPATVKSILASRIDRLAEREKRLLQTASVIGKDFPETLLAEIAGLPVDELKSAIATLRRAEFIYELSLYPSVEYAFKHPLTQEVALASLLTERKRKIHRTLAEAIERQYPDHLDERAPLLAHHWEEAGEALAAARWHTRAANGVGRNDIIAAGYHWVRVRDLLRSSPDDNDATRMGLTACINLLGVAWRAGFALDEINSLLQDGQAFADLLGDPRAGLAVGLTYSRALAAAGDNRRYVTLAAENLRASEQIGDLELQAYAHGFLAEALYFTGSFHESLSTADAGLALCKAGSVFELVLNIGPADAYLEFYPALCLYRMGRAIEARTRHDRCQQNYQVAGMIEIVGYVHSFAAEACYRAHDAEGALDRATQIEEINRKLGDPPVLTSHASMAMAYAHLSSGRPGDAIDPARNACVLHERVEKQLAGMSATLLAAALLESGDLSAAESAAETAIVHCERLMWGASEVEAHGILARVLLRREGAAASKRVTIELNIAASLLKKTGAIEMSPHLLEWRAELAAVLGDEASRTSLLNRAIDGFESIGAPLQAERLRKEMAT